MLQKTLVLAAYSYGNGLGKDIERNNIPNMAAGKLITSEKGMAMALEILYQDNRIIVCIKPAGVLATDEQEGMPSLIRHALGDDTAVIRTVHRLDRVVGGVMVYARTHRAAADLAEQMGKGVFQKEYLAAVHGKPEPAAGEFHDLLWRNGQERKTYIVSEPGRNVREAALSYECLDEQAGLSLVSVRLYTGRTHQIRCQFSGRGLPLTGDGKYGAPDASEHIGLWSHRLEFCHPRTGEKMSFQHTPPAIYPWTLFNLNNEIRICTASAPNDVPRKAE